MIPVSEAYAEAIKAPYRTDRITGIITLSGGTVIEITDENIIANSVTLKEQLVSGDTMEIGTFYTNELNLTVYDEDFLTHSYANARIVIYYGLKLPDNTWEDIPLGIFKVDNSFTRRRGARHMLTAFDCSVEFDRDISGHITTLTVQEHIVSACVEVGVIISENLDWSSFPNVNEVVSIESRSIQSYRDMIEWCSALLGASAKIDRYGKFTLVRLTEKTKETGEYDFDAIISGDERFGTEFFDLRALTKYVSTTFDGQAYVHTTNFILEDEVGRNSIVFVAENPLLKDKANAQEVFVNSLSGFGLSLRRAEFSFMGNPALECFDTIGASGGQIDNNRTITIFPTKLVWKYRGKHSVSCASAELTDEPSSSSVAAIAAVAATPEFTTDIALPAPVKVRNQTEKRIDGVQTGAGEGVGKFTNATKTSEIFNDYTNNTAEGEYNHTAGLNNKNTGNLCSICGGQLNSNSGLACTISGGANNTIPVGAQRCTICGGYCNTTGGRLNAVLGGQDNKIDGTHNAIAAGLNNKITSGTEEARENFIGAGLNNKLSGIDNFIGSGSGNSISSASSHSAIAAGLDNTINGAYSFIGSGMNIEINGFTNVFANGTGLIADRSNQVLFGRYNAPTEGKGVFVIGNGSSPGSRSNCYVIYEDGSVYQG